MRPWSLALPFASIVLAHAFDVNAQTVAPRHTEVEPPRVWYGYQIVAVDVASASLLTQFLRTDNTPFWGWSALGTYGLGPPLVHLANARPWSALASFSLRLGVPTLFTLIGSGCGSRREDVGCQSEAATGALVGLALAHVVDTAVVAWKPEPPPEPARPPAPGAPKPAPKSAPVVPTLDLRPDRFGLGVAGVF